MLMEFRVKNFRAFRDEQTLSMIASKDNTYPQNIEVTRTPEEFRILRTAVFYGANASGKTTILDALEFFENFVLRSAKFEPEKRIPFTPFLLDDESKNSPSEFELTFIQDNVRYQYGFIIQRKIILEEWLISYPKKKPRKLFHRTETENGAKYTFSSYMRGEKEKLIELTKKNALFLSIGATFNNPQLTKIFGWFKKELYHIDATEMNSRLIREVFDEDVYDRVKALIKYADLGITDFSFKEQELLSDLPEDAPESLVKFRQALDELSEELSEEYEIDILDNRIFEVSMIHKTGDRRISFPMHVESAGTQQLFSLSIPILRSLSEGSLLYVDELDSSLHPLLVRALINMYHDPTINNKGAQLIFNTHDTTLLNIGVFRRDQVWFVEKDRDGASYIYSLLDYSPRRHEALEKGYLQGRYGAIPFIGEFPDGVLKSD